MGAARELRRRQVAEDDSAKGKFLTGEAMRASALQPGGGLDGPLYDFVQAVGLAHLAQVWTPTPPWDPTALC